MEELPAAGPLPAAPAPGAALELLFEAPENRAARACGLHAQECKHQAFGAS
jgi:hypothetical protein